MKENMRSGSSRNRLAAIRRQRSRNGVFVSRSNSTRNQETLGMVDRAEARALTDQGRKAGRPRSKGMGCRTESRKSGQSTNYPTCLLYSSGGGLCEVAAPTTQQDKATCQCLACGTTAKFQTKCNNHEVPLRLCSLSLHLCCSFLQRL